MIPARSTARLRCSAGNIGSLHAASTVATAHSMAGRAEQAKIQGKLAGRNILFVEDVESTRLALAAVVQQAGGVAIGVDSTPAAWEAFERREPDVLVSDLGLPRIDDYTLILEQRRTENELQRPSGKPLSYGRGGAAKEPLARARGDTRRTRLDSG